VHTAWLIILLESNDEKMAPDQLLGLALELPATERVGEEGRRIFFMGFDGK